MNRHHYTIVLERQQDGGFHVSCPALKGCHSEGETLDEAIANMREAVTLFLESMAAHGEPIPLDDLLFTPLEVAV